MIFDEDAMKRILFYLRKFLIRNYKLEKNNFKKVSEIIESLIGTTFPVPQFSNFLYKFWL